MRFCPGLRITVLMLAKVCSAAVNGIEACPVEVEVNAGYGDTIIVIVGLTEQVAGSEPVGEMASFASGGRNGAFRFALSWLALTAR